MENRRLMTHHTSMVFSTFLKGKRKALCESLNCQNFTSPVANILNQFTHSTSFFALLWSCFSRVNILPNLDEANASDLPESSMAALSANQWDIVFVQEFTYSSQQLFYTRTPPDRERTEILVFVNSCIWSHAFISNWTVCFCFSFPPPQAEKTDGVYASIYVNEHERTSSSQDYRVLYDYTAQVNKGFKLNIANSVRFKTKCWSKHLESIHCVKELLASLPFSEEDT